MASNIASSPPGRQLTTGTETVSVFVGFDGLKRDFSGKTRKSFCESIR